mgnify:CR=1 FL=1
MGCGYGAAVGLFRGNGVEKALSGLIFRGVRAVLKLRKPSKIDRDFNEKQRADCD